MGLHGGHDASDSLDAVLHQNDSLEKATGKQVMGYRNHRAYYKIPVQILRFVRSYIARPMKNLNKR
jgi:hypothetical protein